jgi:hypothetical protein
MRQLISALGKLSEMSSLSPNSRGQIMEAFREYHSQRRIFGSKKTCVLASAGVITIAIVAVVAWLVIELTPSSRLSFERRHCICLIEQDCAGPRKIPKRPLQLPKGNPEFDYLSAYREQTGAI